MSIGGVTQEARKREVLQTAVRGRFVQLVLAMIRSWLPMGDHLRLHQYQLSMTTSVTYSMYCTIHQYATGVRHRKKTLAFIVVPGDELFSAEPV